MAENKRRKMGLAIEIAQAAEEFVFVGVDETSELTKAPYRYRVHQQKPNTMVELWRTGEYNLYRSLGFAKVCWPDEWDEEFGVELALIRAAVQMIRDNQHLPLVLPPVNMPTAVRGRPECLYT